MTASLVKPIPTAPVVTATPACGYVKLNTTSTGAGITFTWNTGAVTSAITVFDSNVYSVSRISGGCTSSASTVSGVPADAPPTPV